MASPRTVERPSIRDLYEGRARPYRERVAPYRRERREFGGHIQWEAVFFGLLAAIGLVASLIAMVLGGLVAAGVADFRDDAASLVDRMATGGGAIGVAILALGYMAGGYVAARMARFDGWRQGLGVWLLSLLLLLAAAITAWIAGGELDPTKSVTLPSNPIDEGPLHNSDVALAAVAVLVPLTFALIGGVLGERFHRAVDRVGFEPEPEPVPDEEFEPEPEEDRQVEDEERTAEQDQETKPVP
jgi:hypothetical protein